jgi:hypothetical protein
MVEANQPNPEIVTFYEKVSCCRPVRQLANACSNTHRNHLNAPLHYPFLVEQNRFFPTELVVANTDYTLKIMNLETGQA